ncbi:hypothetical protein HL653_09870 [Sphingomonas sp. AP4-R1]|uniref:tetratricopeptide repeat protein n=1 Tax=Sphingomonas sp. AP4-R1 TaxID=2735134 RepID=UPI001493C496|nr:tetratricopeptide repeat protein [Sphingomonas sp. AP4-R1]QJU58066.1 hypothetical protein HL653_09870 [Sphingomonas sp. AP4-R1]
MHVRNSYPILFASLVFMSSPVCGQAHQSDLEQAKQLLREGHADQSLALIDPIISRAMSEEAKDPAAICPSEAVAVLQGFMKGGFKISIENDWCDALLLKGYALNELKRPTEAAQTLEILVGHAPNNAQYLTEYAYAVRVNGDPERALSVYKRAETASSKLPDRASIAHWRAVALRGQGYSYTDLERWDDATKAYRNSLKYEPKNEIAQHELRYIDEHRPH